MSFTTKQWKDRISEYPTRRTLTDTTTSAVSTVTVAREEGTILQEGDAFSAANMNDLESRILLASTGFIAQNTVFNSDGNITETSVNGSKNVTTFNADGSITEKLYATDGTTILFTHVTTFNADGSITETVS
jgi:hypothetical protein